MICWALKLIDYQDFLAHLFVLIGLEAKAILSLSGLPKSTLAQIWYAFIVISSSLVAD